jgi:hypothetical protein
MVDFVIILVVAFLAGILVKAVDWLDDDRKSRHPVKFLLAVFYGIAIGYVIGTASFALIFLAALIAQILARKVDTMAHIVGFVFAIILLPFFGIPYIDLALLAYFLVLAFIDEGEYIGSLKFISDYRPFLKFGALPLVLIGRWDYFVGIMVFDFGYELTRYVLTKKYGANPARA